MTDEIDRLDAGLTAMERERLTGWRGVGGAAYNVISEDLCEIGLLNADWSLSPLGQQVRARIKERVAADEIAALKAERDAMREAGEALRREASLLLQNSEGCAANHYGPDCEIHGMPGWLADSRQRIETAARALIGPAQ